MNKALLFVILTVLVDIIGVAIIIPIVPDLIKNLSGTNTSDAATIGGLLTGIYALMQFLFAPVLGELSDRYGRRPLLLISLLGLGIDYIFHALAPTIAWLFVGRVVAGIFGASYSVATAYIADISSKEEKAKNFGMIGVAFGVGFMIGPVIGGICGKFGTAVPFYVSAALTLLNFLFGLFFIPESLAKSKRRTINYTKMIPFVSLASMRKYRQVLGLIIAITLVNLAGQVMPAIWSYFTIENFQWDELDIGISLGVVGLLVGVVQGGLVGYLVKTYGEKKVILWGFIFWTLGMILLSLAFTPSLLYIFLVPYILGGIAGPTLQGVISNEVPDNEQGNLQGTITSIAGLTAFIGPILFSTIFTFFTKKDAVFYYPGASFALGGIILVVATFIAFKSLRKE